MTKFEVKVQEAHAAHDGGYISVYEAPTKFDAMKEALSFIKEFLYENEEIELIATAKVVR